MSNEELALKIQAGENRYEELWNRVKGFIFKQAFSYSRYFPDSTIEVDDLAQAGYLALCAAVRDYDPAAGGNLLTVLRFKLRNVWRAMYGLRGKDDVFYTALSLDEPIDDESDTTRLDMIQDPAAELSFAQADEEIYQSELREALERALVKVPHGDVIRKRYFEGKTGTELAKEYNVSAGAIYDREKAGLRYLRAGPFTRELRSFDFYHGTGFQAWKCSGASIEERYVIQREKVEREI